MHTDVPNGNECTKKKFLSKTSNHWIMIRENATNGNGNTDGHCRKQAILMVIVENKSFSYKILHLNYFCN